MPPSVSPARPAITPKVRLAVAVAALGYFVDIYDLILFGIIRVPSLQALGYSGAEMTRQGEWLMSMQMVGMLVGGILWGILGDRRGRLSVLFGSIVLYSLANLANGFAVGIWDYTLYRLLAGIGLAGELGAGITLVSELLPPRQRGIGTTLVASFGILGAVAAFFVGDADWGQGPDNWRVAYFVGGGLGLALLALRVGVLESGLFGRMKTQTQVSRGNFWALFAQRERFMRYLKGILVGLPTWYTIGLFIFFAPEFAASLNLAPGAANQVADRAGFAIMICYLGLSLGDLSSGLLSQWLQSRRLAMLIFLVITLISIGLYTLQQGTTANQFYALCFMMGFGAGYWAVFVTSAAEQFGTNLRATVATTTPNFVRGSVSLILPLHSVLRGHIGLLPSAWVLGVLVFGLAFWALATLPERFGSSLDFYEDDGPSPHSTL